MSKNLRCWLFIGMSALLLPGLGYSDEMAKFKVELSPQPLSEALRSLADQTGLQIVFFSEVTDGMQSVALNGEYTSDAAFDELLTESGLSYEYINDQTVTIRPASTDTSEGHDLGKSQLTSQPPLLSQAQTSAAQSQTRAQSQTASEENRDKGQNVNAIEEILVTAAKRGEQNLQRVPLSISAITETMLEDMGADNFSDFSRTMPGLTFIDEGPGDKQYVIRGIRAVGSSTVGVYFDETVLTSSRLVDGGGRQPDIKLFDLERIEVLRGPQGTLYGAGSMSGTIRFITNKPDPAKWDYKVSVAASNTKSGSENYQFNGMLNVPIVEDTFAVRLTGWSRDESGFIDNIRLGNTEINNEDTVGGRIQLRWIPSEQVTLTASFLHQNTESDGRQRFFPDDGDLMQSAFAVEPWDDEIDIYSITGEFNFSTGSLIATSNWFERDVVFSWDTTPLFLFFGVPGIPIVSIQPQTHRIFSNEVRFSSSFDGPIQFVLGAFSQDSKRSFVSRIPVVSSSGRPLDPASFVLARSGVEDFEERAIFGEVSYDVSERLTLMAGLRWFESEQVDNGFLLAPFSLGGPLLPEPVPQPERTASDDRLTPKFLISYQTSDDLLIYAQAAEGFRVGGTNDPTIFGLPAENLDFDADSLWNYEIGVKSSWYEDRLIVNADIYHIKWDNMQVNDAFMGVGFINNAGKAQVTGFELEAIAQPIDGLVFTIAASLLSAELKEDQPRGEGDNLPGLDGDQLPKVPEFTGSASVQYMFELESLPFDGRVRLDYSYTDDSQTTFRPNDPFFRIMESYSIVNLRVGVISDKWQASLFVDNLFDERAQVNVVENIAEVYSVFTNRPRTVGISFQTQY